MSQTTTTNTLEPSTSDGALAATVGPQGDRSDICSICLEVTNSEADLLTHAQNLPAVPTDTVEGQLKGCMNSWHASCIAEWLAQSATPKCPVCRQLLNDGSLDDSDLSLDGVIAEGLSGFNAEFDVLLSDLRSHQEHLEQELREMQRVHDREAQTLARADTMLKNIAGAAFNRVLNEMGQMALGNRSYESLDRTLNGFESTINARGAHQERTPNNDSERTQTVPAINDTEDNLDTNAGSDFGMIDIEQDSWASAMLLKIIGMMWLLLFCLRLADLIWPVSSTQ